MTARTSTVVRPMAVRPRRTAPPFEMLLPSISSRVESSRQLTGARIESGDVGSLVVICTRSIRVRRCRDHRYRDVCGQSRVLPDRSPCSGNSCLRKVTYVDLSSVNYLSRSWAGVLIVAGQPASRSRVNFPKRIRTGKEGSAARYRQGAAARQPRRNRERLPSLIAQELANVWLRACREDQTAGTSSLSAARFAVAIHSRMKNGNLLHRGRVVAPDGPGLGIHVDWDSLATANFHVYSKLDFSVSPE